MLYASTWVNMMVSDSISFELDEDEKPDFIWSINHNGVTTKNVMSLILANDHKVTASIQPVDAKGNPAAIDGLAAWSSSSADIVTVTNISADSLSADVVPGTALGTAQINVTADADLGSGVTTINGVLDVQVVAGQAVGFTISTSPPVPVS